MKIQNVEAPKHEEENLDKTKPCQVVFLQQNMLFFVPKKEEDLTVYKTYTEQQNIKCNVCRMYRVVHDNISL